VGPILFGVSRCGTCERKERGAGGLNRVLRNTFFHLAIKGPFRVFPWRSETYGCEIRSSNYVDRVNVGTSEFRRYWGIGLLPLGCAFKTPGCSRSKASTPYLGHSASLVLTSPSLGHFWLPQS
jgi:hypothetical protein